MSSVRLPYTPAGTLPGPSKTIIVEPLERPMEEPQPVEAPEPPAEKEAEPAKAPVK